MKRTKYEQSREAEFFKFLDIEYPYKAPTPAKHKTDPNKILSIADPHEPYGNEAVYKEALSKHGDCFKLVVPGDLGDFYSKSRFRKTRHVSFKEECQSIFRRMEWFSRNFVDTEIMIGNHDDRPEKMIATVLDGQTDLQILTESDIMRRMASYFSNVKIVGMKVGADINLNHIYQVGDIVFTHVELSRAQESAVMERISMQLHRWKERLNLKPFKVVAQAHCHTELRQAKGGEYWFLMPTASNPFSIGMEYAFSPRFIGNPTQLGYTVFHQVNGKTDYNRSHNYLVG